MAKIIVEVHPDGTTAINSGLPSCKVERRISKGLNDRDEQRIGEAIIQAVTRASMRDIQYSDEPFVLIVSFE